MKLIFKPSKKLHREARNLRDNKYCAVIAVAEAKGMSYKEAYDALARQGREHGKGSSKYKIMKATNVENLYQLDYETTLKEFVNEFPLGNYIAFTENHAIAVRDGVVKDFFQSPRTIVKSYVEMCLTE